MAIAAVYVVGLAFALLAPTSWRQADMASWVATAARDVGVPAQWATQGRAEALCNAAIVAPLTVLAALWWPTRSWLEWTGLAFVLASAVEFVQGVALPGRMASFVDIVANTLGVCVAAAFVAALRPVAAAPRRVEPPEVSRRRTAAGTRPRSLPR